MRLTETRVGELATEETRKFFPGLETQDHGRFLAMVQFVTKTIVNDYDLSAFGSEDSVSQLIAVDLKETFKR